VHDLTGSRTLVLGAGGFIGSNLTDSLVARGAHVTGYGRRRRHTGGIRDLAWIDADFADEESLRSAVDEADVIVHLLGSRTPGTSNADPTYETRINLPQNMSLLTLCSTKPSLRFVYVSSGGAIYSPTATLPLTEDSPTDPITAYGIGKLATEKFIGLYSRLYGMRSVILRVSNPFGRFQSPSRGQGLVSTLIDRALTGEPVEIWGDGSGVRDYVYIDDVVDAIIAGMCHDGDPTVFNIGSGRGRSVNEVVRDVEVACGTTIDVRALPKRGSDLDANVLDIRRAAAALGWSPTTSWQDGLRETVAWHRSLVG